MKGSVHSQLERIEEKLRKKYRAVLELPPGVPEALRLKVLKRQYKEIRREWNDPEEKEMRRLFPDAVLHVTGCTADCPDCELLPWCTVGRENIQEEAGDFDGLDEDDDLDLGEEDDFHPMCGPGEAEGIRVEEIGEAGAWAGNPAFSPTEGSDGGKLFHVRIPLPHWLRGNGRAKLD